MQDKGGDPPRITGPLTLNNQNCGQKGNRPYCDFDYVLDPSSTNDPQTVARVLEFSSVRRGGEARFLHD